MGRDTFHLRRVVTGCGVVVAPSSDATRLGASSGWVAISRSEHKVRTSSSGPCSWVSPAYADPRVSIANDCLTVISMHLYNTSVTVLGLSIAVLKEWLFLAGLLQ
uniref:Uncharacterized protein n=1 Tax=Cressdnaviricota sp. TaxID=2748378 RepID=A0A6M3YPC0_9VIRU|nr:MAG: hypothetical protein [Cressdnaviricota sp.]QJI53660.1 MAG: hypothetical protein [Cressdnaviricota sp.]QJI53663.1 MAG: hypothetical protein [Cressdnaviricota sp.]